MKLPPHHASRVINNGADSQHFSKQRFCNTSAHPSAVVFFCNLPYFTLLFISLASGLSRYRLCNIMRHTPTGSLGATSGASATSHGRRTRQSSDEVVRTQQIFPGMVSSKGPAVLSQSTAKAVDVSTYQ